MQNSLMTLFRAIIFLIVWEISVVVSDSLKINITTVMYLTVLIAISFTFILAMRKYTPHKRIEENIVLLVVGVIFSAILLLPMFLFNGFYSIAYLVILLVIPGFMFSGKTTAGEKLYEHEEKPNDSES